EISTTNINEQALHEIDLINNNGNNDDITSNNTNTEINQTNTFLPASNELTSTSKNTENIAFYNKYLQVKQTSSTSNYFLSLLFFQSTNSVPSPNFLNDPAKIKNFQFLKKAYENVLNTLNREYNQTQFVILCP